MKQTGGELLLSPITGKEMERIVAPITLSVAGKEYAVNCEFWLCKDSKETFEDVGMADRNLLEIKKVSVLDNISSTIYKGTK